jgi:hypothetical protein
MANSALPKEYGYVVLVASSSALVAVWHGINVISTGVPLFIEPDRVDTLWLGYQIP